MLSWVTSVGPEKMMSLSNFVLILDSFFFFFFFYLFFLSNFLFSLLDQLKGLICYFHYYFLLSIFHANLVIWLELLSYILNGS